MAFLLGKKLEMSQIWKDGNVVPVTVISVSPNTVSLLRKKDKDGYTAVQLRLEKTTREFRIEEEKEEWKEGSTVGVDAFKEGEKVRVSGAVKGRGFQGVVKRHGFHGGPKSHGQKDRHRAPGSIGSTGPQRVVPGKKMAGRMGGNRVTVQNLVVAEVDSEKHLLFVRGAVPGARGTLLEIRSTGRQKNEEEKK